MNTERQVLQGATEAIRRSSPYTPAKLDTLASSNGDTILSKRTVDEYDPEGAHTSQDELATYLEELHDTMDSSTLAVKGLIRQRLLELALAGVMVDQVTGEVDRSDDIRRLEAERYSHYSPVLFKAALCKKIELLEATSVPKDLEIAKASLLDELDDYASAVQIEGEEVMLEQPSEKTLTVVGEWLEGQFSDIFEMINTVESDELDASQLVEVFNLAIDTTPDLRNNGWKAKVIERAKSAVSVRASSREVVVPSQKQVSKDIAKNLVVHEVFGHALRSGIAESNGDEIGVAGTATYSEFEESFEIALEQCLNRKYDPNRGIDHYVSIGFVESLGLSQDKVAQLTKSMRQITLAGDKLTPEKISQAERMAERQIRRTFAGMTDIDRGIAHRKDINYLHGLNGAWKLLNAIAEADQVDEGMRWLLSAKFNPFNPIDRELLNEMAPMPSSIKSVVEGV